MLFIHSRRHIAYPSVCVVSPLLRTQCVWCHAIGEVRWRKWSNGFRLFTWYKFEAKIINMIVKILRMIRKYYLLSIHAQLSLSHNHSSTKYPHCGRHVECLKVVCSFPTSTISADDSTSLDNRTSVGTVMTKSVLPTIIARLIGPTWGPSGANSTRVGPMLAPLTLLSGYICIPIWKSNTILQYRYAVSHMLWTIHWRPSKCQITEHCYYRGSSKA